jgi:SAM-dependent methyltransferase
MSLAASLARKYLSLAPAHPPVQWIQPEFLRRSQIEYEDELAGGFLKWFPKLDLKNKQVFDVGCGFGGRAVRFIELGARNVVGLEPFEEPCIEGAAFANNRGIQQLQFVVAAGESVPFADNSFDLVTSYDVFEHVENLADVLAECRRVLKPGGALYAVFPPFHHPTGSHLDGWVSKMPWPNVLFTCKTLIESVNGILKDRRDGFVPKPMRPTDPLWTLNGATIRSVRRLLRQSNFTKAEVRLCPLFSEMNGKWDEWKMKYYAFAFRPLGRIPFVNEMFVHRMVLIGIK